jgi:glycosyltransferase involved in cell wall biosynthesis
MREKLLAAAYRMFPFDLRGDCVVSPSRDGIRISCIVNFYGRLDLLAGILHSLASQAYPREAFEVLLVEDRGGTPEGKALAEEFSGVLQIRYLPLDANFGMMGYSRNFGLERSRGDVILFLDDDTVILQRDFLRELAGIFAGHPDADAVIPRGSASFGLVQGRYAHHDEFFMTSRCMAYRREVLKELGGFVSTFVGQEDVEFVIRFMIAGKTALRVPELEYFHPPLLVPNLRKPKAVGASFYRLRGRYSMPVWLLMLANCSRHAPLYLVPVRRFREMGRFGIGFLAGVAASVFTGEGFQYS